MKYQNKNYKRLGNTKKYSDNMYNNIAIIT